MGKNKKNRGGKGKGAKKKKGVSLPPSHYINKQQNQDSLTSNPNFSPENSTKFRPIFTMHGGCQNASKWL